MPHFVLSSPTVACFDLPKQRTCQTVFPPPLLMSKDLYYISKANLPYSFINEFILQFIFIVILSRLCDFIVRILVALWSVV